MFAVITTEEYKDLLLAKEKNAELEDAVLTLGKERDKAEESLKELLLMITKGEKAVISKDRGFVWYELARTEEIAEYLNNNYLDNGILTFTKKENTNE